MKKIMMGCLAAVAVLIALASCSQDYTTYSGPSHIMFSDTLYQYAVQESNEVFNVPVSATEKADYDRTFGVEVVDKQSNAIEGKHYRILNNTVTIKAGEMVGNVQVQGIYDNIGKTDSLGFTLKLVIPEKYNWTDLYKDYAHVVMQKSCPFDIHNFSGWCMVTSTFYSKYLNNALGDELLAELRPKLREELVNDTAFVDAVRGVVQNALSNAAAGVNKGWKEKAILAQFRSDLLKVQDPVEQEMIKLSGIIGDLVESSLAEKINKLLPFGDLTSWIGKWVGEFAKDKAVSAVVGETGMVHDTIELYIKYITCPGHDYHYITTRATTCTEDGEEKLKCSKCGWVRSDNKITHEKLGHVPVIDEAADPTETEEGLTEGSHCARCGAVLEAQEVIPALQPQMDAQLVCSAIPEEAVTAMRYENRKKLDAAMDAALTKAGYTAADSQRFLALVNSSIGILPNDRYPEKGFTGYVPRPAQTAADKKYTWYAVQLLTVDAHGCNAGDVIITPVAQTDKGLQLTVYAQAVVALAWKEAE